MPPTRAFAIRDSEAYDFMDIPHHQQWSMWADRALKNGKLVAVSTSQGYTYYFRKMISLCTIDVVCRNPGSEVAVGGGTLASRRCISRQRLLQPPIRKTIDEAMKPFLLNEKIIKGRAMQYGRNGYE
jgi:vanillate/3-O-methylgallate O-demethylase